MVAYPPPVPPATRTDSTLAAGVHAQDHDQLAAGLAAVIAVLGAAPEGGYADLTARLIGEQLGVDQSALTSFLSAVNAASAARDAAQAVLNALPAGLATTDAQVAALNSGPATATRAAIANLFLRIRAGIFHDSTTRPDGPITAGDLTDSGDPVDNNVGSNPLRYLLGRMIHTAGTVVGTNNAGYLQFRVRFDRVRRMLAKVMWPAGALGAATFVVPSARWNQSAGQLPVAGLHSTHYANGVWVCGVWNPAAGQAGHVEAHRLDVKSGTSVTLSVTTTTPAGTQSTGSLTIDSTFTAASLQAALASLSNVGGLSNVTVVGPFSGRYGIVWAAGLGTVTMAVTASTGTVAPVITKYGTGVTTYADYTTNTRYATQTDGALHDLDCWLEPELGRAIIYFPDGTNSGWFYDPGINLWCADYAVFELFENNTSAIDVPAQYGRVTVDNIRPRSDTPAITKPDVTALLNTALAATVTADPRPKTLIRRVNETIVTPTGASTEVVDSVTRRTFTVPPSGRYAIKLRAYVTLDNARSVYWLLINGANGSTITSARVAAAITTGNYQEQVFILGSTPGAAMDVRWHHIAGGSGSSGATIVGADGLVTTEARPLEMSFIPLAAE